MTITDYLMNVALIGLVLLQVRGRTLTRVALVLPVVITVYVCSQYLHGVPMAGNDLVLETGLGLLGAALGIAAGLTTSVRSVAGDIVAKAGLVAAALWVLGVGARVGVSIWVSNGGAPAMARFSQAAHITSGMAWTAAFILMAMAEVLCRTAVIYLKARGTGEAIPRGGFLGATRSPVSA